MEYTENYQFREPTPAVDIVKVGDINYNSRKIDELIHNTQTSLAPAYDATRTSSNPYMTGDVVMKDALMYRCLEDDVYGAWDATKWERTTAGEEGAGGSSVEANPQGTPTDDLDKIGINGTIYNIAGSGGGGGNVYGAFIDTSRVIQSRVQVAAGDTGTYTAAEDCIVAAEYYGGANGGDIKVDGVTVSQIYSPSNASVNNVVCIPLKRGQAFSIRSIQYPGAFTVYGLTFGTQNIFTPQIYSTEERCVGVWIDNKPLYQKSYSLNTAIRITQSGANITRYIDNESVIEQIVSARGNNTSTAENQGTDLWVGRGSSNLMAYSSESSDVDVITLWYTKTTDTAGSGSYNTLGVPMVHYTTDEQVVGTDENGNTVYEKTFTATITTNVQNLLSAAGIDLVYKAEVLAYNNSKSAQILIPYNNGADYASLQVYGGNLRLLTSDWFKNTVPNLRCTIRYTKSSS